MRLLLVLAFLPNVVFAQGGGGVDVTTNGCGVLFRDTQPPAKILAPRGPGNRVFANDLFDLCIPLAKCDNSYGGIFEGSFYFASPASINRDGNFIRIEYVARGSFLACPTPPVWGFARLSLRLSPPGRYDVEFARGTLIAGVSTPHVVQGRIEVDVIEGPEAIPVTVNQPWALVLLGLMTGVAAMSILRTRLME